MNVHKKPTWAMTFVLCLIPFAMMFWIWLSPLAFVPVPWPDDSAFYFVAHDLFKWPPRWVMLPQAPFEPTYRIFNFNTMPLYPVLIGVGRWLGIDGSFALKIWPLGAWALSGALLIGVLYRSGLPALACLIVGLAFSLDPALRWASVLVRPESLIGLFGVALVFLLSLRPTQPQTNRWWWDPIAALLALGAYAHFNAVHLVFPVVLGLLLRPSGEPQFERLFKIGTKTLLYLSPWIATVLWHFPLFIKQMSTQWKRLAIPNAWLNTPDAAIDSLFQQLGSPVSWHPILRWAAIGLWLLIFAAILWGLIIPLGQTLWQQFRKNSQKEPEPSEGKTGLPSLVPATGWVLGAIWLWNSKPEVWFIFYLHIALWTFAGMAALWLWKNHQRKAFGAWLALLLPMIVIFGFTNGKQFNQLSEGSSWKWSTYTEFVECIHGRLLEIQKTKANQDAFRVWCPTFPDVTIELSRRNPDWEFTRTNDFMDRSALAIQHGFEADAVVVTETLNWTERNLNAPWKQHPDVNSLWMSWPGYYLNSLFQKPEWKQDRFLCQRGRWQAFIFSEPTENATTMPASLPTFGPQEH